MKDQPYTIEVVTTITLYPELDAGWRTTAHTIVQKADDHNITAGTLLDDSGSLVTREEAANAARNMIAEEIERQLEIAEKRQQQQEAK